MSWDPREDAWFAGFTDGEGSFNIVRNSGGTCNPRFKISLRIDDAAVLEGLEAAFGGFVSFLAASHASTRPAAQWVVSAKRDLPALLAYFDRFPLRAKKARDYVIWRRAVRIYCDRGGAVPELVLLRDALAEIRRYDGPELVDRPEVEIPDHQLRLIEGG